MVYYPIPLSRQSAYAHYPSVPTPVSEALSGQVVSLPMHPYLDEVTQNRINGAVLAAVG
jgi:dTDP-4-amino-4,6-dideoxygalactose transaminase